MLLLIISTITFLVEEHAPFKKLAKKQVKLKSKHWIDADIKNKRDKLINKYLKSKDPINQLVCLMNKQI